MIKNTLIVDAEEAANTYRTSMMEHFYSDMTFTSVEDFAMDLKEFSKELWELCSDPDRALPAFRELFSKGSTMMLLNDEQFTQLEAWDKNNEDFQIVIFKKDGSAVGIVHKVYISW